MNNSAVHFMLLGVAQDGGLPQCGCSCSNCGAARASSRTEGAASAALIDPAADSCWLLDCGPDFKQQFSSLQDWLAAHQLGHCKLRGVLLTHCHMGHYVGLLQFGREVMDWRGLQVWGTPSVLTFLRTNEPYRSLAAAGTLALMPQLASGTTLQLSPRVTVTPRAVPHRAEFSDAVGFFITGPSGRRAFYLPDIDSWAAWAAAAQPDGADVREVVGSVDLAVLDGTFYNATELPGRDMRQVPHPLITDTMERLRGVAGPGGTTVVITHMNHTNPVWRRGSPQRAAAEAAGLTIGELGLVYEL